jgi:hypothetical protein
MEKQHPPVPKSHLEHVAKKHRKLGAPSALERNVVHGKKAFDSSGYKPDISKAYANSGEHGGTY